MSEEKRNTRILGLFDNLTNVFRKEEDAIHFQVAEKGEALDETYLTDLLIAFYMHFTRLVPNVNHDWWYFMGQLGRLSCDFHMAQHVKASYESLQQTK